MHVTIRMQAPLKAIAKASVPAPKPAPKTKIGNGRDPHAGAAVDKQGDTGAWQHGHYEYK